MIVAAPSQVCTPRRERCQRGVLSSHGLVTQPSSSPRAILGQRYAVYAGRYSYPILCLVNSSCED